MHLRVQRKNLMNLLINSILNNSKVEEFFRTMPKLSHTLKVTNPKTGVESEVVLEGLASFFQLESYYKVNFALMQHHKYSLSLMSHTIKLTLP